MSPPLIRDATSGFWGYPTATMDWCEENYAVTKYIAEFWNSISNVVFIVPPLWALYYFHAYKLTEDRYKLSLSLLALIGFGSFAFHCTLLYESQLLDELPMIYGTCSMLYAILLIREPEHQLNRGALIGLTILSLAISFVYLVWKNPLIFLWSYGLTSAVSSIYHIRACVKYNGSKRLLMTAMFSYGFGFVLWNIDNELCYYVRDARNALPYVLQPLLQLHAWWHALAGIGTYLMIMFSVEVRIKCLGHKPELVFIKGTIPYYVKSRTSSVKSSNNKYDMNGNTSSAKFEGGRNGSVGKFARLL